MEQPGIPGISAQAMPGSQPPFMPSNNYPGMPTGFNPNMVPPGMGGGFPGQMPMGGQPVPGGMPGPDNSVVAHKPPSSQVHITRVFIYYL